MLLLLLLLDSLPQTWSILEVEDGVMELMFLSKEYFSALKWWCEEQDKSADGTHACLPEPVTSFHLLIGLRSHKCRLVQPPLRHAVHAHFERPKPGEQPSSLAILTSHISRQARSHPH